MEKRVRKQEESSESKSECRFELEARLSGSRAVISTREGVLCCRVDESLDGGVQARTEEEKAAGNKCDVEQCLRLA